MGYSWVELNLHFRVNSLFHHNWKYGPVGLLCSSAPCPLVYFQSCLLGLPHLHEIACDEEKIPCHKGQENWDHVYFVHPSTDISADISTDSRPMYRSTYRSSVGRYVGRYIGQESVDMSADICRSTYRPMYICRVMVDISTDYRPISRSI